MQLKISEIPENSSGSVPPIKVTKKPSNAKKVAINNTAQVYEYDAGPKRPNQISYEDILSKMNMYVSDGKLHLMDRSDARTMESHRAQSQAQAQSQPKPQSQPQPQPTPRPDYVGNEQQSYIYNKYFKNEFKEEPTVRRPKTLAEYKQMLLADYIQRERVKQIKSRKIIIPGSNYNSYAHRPPQDMNALFNFSRR
jgi:hypothetical protein